MKKVEVIVRTTEDNFPPQEKVVLKFTEDDLKLLTLYAYEGYNESEISKVFNVSQPAIHKRIIKISIFLKKF